MSARNLSLTLAGWTLLIWISRIRNIVADDELVGWSRTWRMGAAVGFVAAAVIVVAAALSGRDRLTSVVARWLAVVGIGWWLIRGLQTLLADHDIGFKIVHTILALVTVSLSLAVLDRLRSGSGAAVSA